MKNARPNHPLGGFWATSGTLLLLWLIAVWHTHAQLAPDIQRDQTLVKQGFLPLAFDFQARNQLMPNGAEGAVVIAEATGLRLQTTRPAFDLRLNLHGAQFDPADVRRMRWEWLAAQPSAVKWWLVVSAHATDAGWIAELPDFTPDIALRGLRFSRSQRPNEKLAWEKLPNIQFVRLYGEAPVGMHVVPKRLAFVAMAGVRLQAVSVPTMNPIAALTARDQALAQGTWMTLGHQNNLGRGLSAIVGVYPWVLLALVGAWFWRGKTALNLNAAIGLSLAVLMAIAAAYLPENREQLPLWQQLFYAGLLLVSIALAWCQSPEAHQPERSSQPIWVATLALSALIVLGFGWPDRWPNPQRLAGYAAFALLQQMILQRAVFTPLSKTMPEPAAIALSAFLFALWHTPNGTLMLLCFLGGMLWCYDFHRRGKLWPLVASHILLGWLVVACLPTEVLRNTQIGAAYFMPGGSSR